MSCGLRPVALCIVQRATWRVPFIVGTLDDAEAFTALDPTLDTFDFVAVDEAGVAFLTLTTVNGGITIEDGADPETGAPTKLVVLSHTAAQTAALPAKSGTYKVFWHRQDVGESVLVMLGPVSILKAAAPT
jgi:hypothetical protein